MELEINDSDFKEVLGDAEYKSLESGDDEHLGAFASGGVVDRVAKVVAAKMQKMAPDGFKVDRIAIKFAIKGSVLGTGLNGDVSVTFVPVAE